MGRFLCLDGDGFVDVLTLNLCDFAFNVDSVCLGFRRLLLWLGQDEVDQCVDLFLREMAEVRNPSVGVLL